MTDQSRGRRVLAHAPLYVGAMAAACMVQFADSYITSRRAMEREINNDGHRIVRCLAAVGTEYWGVRDPISAPLSPSPLGFTAEPLMPIDPGRTLSTLRENSPEIIELFVTDGYGTWLTGIHDPGEQRSIAMEDSRRLDSEAPDIETFEGYVTQGTRRIRVRQYQKAIPPDVTTGRGGGFVILLRSADSIDGVVTDLLPSLARSLLASLILGTSMALLLAIRADRQASPPMAPVPSTGTAVAPP